MVAPAISGERVPCTMSRNAVTGYLREKLHFDGLILSDCLEMNAVKSYFGVERGAVEAVKAGIDLVFVSHTAALLEKAMDAVRSAVTAGEIPQRRIDEAVFRILRAKERLLDVRTSGIYAAAYGVEGVFRFLSEGNASSVAARAGVLFPGRTSALRGDRSCPDQRRCQ